MTGEINNPDSDENPFNPAPVDSPPEPRRPSGTVAQRRTKAVLRENMLLAAMFAGGLIAVYLLSLRGGPAKAAAGQSDVQLQVDSAVMAFQTAPDATAKATAAKIKEMSLETRQRQIPLEKLRRNPFMFAAAPRPAVPTTLTNKTPPPPEPVIERDPDKDAAMAVIKQLKLQSVLMGDDGKALAMISNNLLAEGQVVSGWTISKIETGRVTLAWRDQTQVLSLRE